MDKLTRRVNLVIIIAVLAIGLFAYSKYNGSFGASATNDFYAGTVTATTTTLAAGKASVVLKENNGRSFATLTNVSGTIAYLAFNATSSPNTIPLLEEKNYVIPLAASGGSYTINLDNLYLGQVIATSSAAVEIRALEVQ